jgi:hypothetical protein
MLEEPEELMIGKNAQIELVCSSGSVSEAGSDMTRY